MASTFARLQIGHRLNKINRYCTMRSATPVVKLPRGSGGTNTHSYKWRTLTECMEFFFEEDFSAHAHNAWEDARAVREYTGSFAPGGRNMRDRVLIELDKAGAEWVVVAYLAGDARMIEICESGRSPHPITGSYITGIPVELIEKKLERNTSE